MPKVVLISGKAQSGKDTFARLFKEYAEPYEELENKRVLILKYGDKLPDNVIVKLKEVIEYRMKYKESSLSELANIISSETGVEITKSGLNHRFRKIKEILENYLKEKEKSK